MALLGRDTKITGPVDETVFLLETFQGKETLGIPYRYDLTLLSRDARIAVDEILGQSLTVHIKLDTGDWRYWNGIVTYFAKTGMAMEHTRYVAVLNPTLTIFDYTRDCRVFFDLQVPDLVKGVLGQRGYMAVETGGLQGTYPTREFTVQYRETDFNFVQRLLEEEGIYYFFKHEDGKHTLKLADSGSAHAAVSGYEQPLYLPRQRKQAREEEHFWTLSAAGSLFPGKFSVLRGYDYEKPRPSSILTQIEEKRSELAQPGGIFEDYDYPGGLYEKAEAEAEASVRLEGALVANTLIEVEGNTMGLGVGDLVKLRKPLSLENELNPFWNDDDFDKEYLIISATYSISINQYETGVVAEADEPFKATYSLLNNQSRFRPARTVAKPRIDGPQTAIVVGPAGQEIHTDELGRVKVQFDWDRLGNRDEKSSIWVRVAQVWAGKQWGAIHIPRIGHEVMVEFLDGDPDRPIITGRVYNKDNMPPYALPANMTQSGIKSRSSKGGTEKNFNEIRFEDLKDHEELHIQAERDMSTQVKRNQSLTVGGNRSVSVTGNETVTITGNQVVSVSGKGKDPIKSATKVTGKYDLDVSDTIHMKAPTSITLECPGSKIEMLPGKITITSGDGAQLVLDANALTKGSGGGQTLHDANVLSKSHAGAKIVLDDTVQAKSVGGSEVVLDGKATVKGNTEGTLTAAGSTVKTAAPGVDISGTEVKVTGSATVTVTGGMVKLNS